MTRTTQAPAGVNGGRGGPLEVSSPLKNSFVTRMSGLFSDEARVPRWPISWPGASPMTSREPRWIERRAARGVRTKLCQRRDTTRTNDKAMRRLSIQPFGLRRLVAVCCVSPPRRILLDTTSSSILASGHKALATRPRQVVGAALITLRSSRVENDAMKQNCAPLGHTTLHGPGACFGVRRNSAQGSEEKQAIRSRSGFSTGC